jgi:hypothetical protein
MANPYRSIFGVFLTSFFYLTVSGCQKERPVLVNGVVSPPATQHSLVLSASPSGLGQAEIEIRKDTSQTFSHSEATPGLIVLEIDKGTHEPVGTPALKFFPNTTQGVTDFGAYLSKFASGYFIAIASQGGVADFFRNNSVLTGLYNLGLPLSVKSLASTQTFTFIGHTETGPENGLVSISDKFLKSYAALDEDSVIGHTTPIQLTVAGDGLRIENGAISLVTGQRGNVQNLGTEDDVRFNSVSGTFTGAHAGAFSGTATLTAGSFHNGSFINGVFNGAHSGTFTGTGSFDGTHLGTFSGTQTTLTASANHIVLNNPSSPSSSIAISAANEGVLHISKGNSTLLYATEDMLIADAEGVELGTHLKNDHAFIDFHSGKGNNNNAIDHDTRIWSIGGTSNPREGYLQFDARAVRISGHLWFAQTAVTVPVEGTSFEAPSSQVRLTCVRLDASIPLPTPIETITNKISTEHGVVLTIVFQNTCVMKNSSVTYGLKLSENQDAIFEANDTLTLMHTTPNIWVETARSRQNNIEQTLSVLRACPHFSLSQIQLQAK